MEYQHGGDIYSNRVRIDFSANINPFGMPEGVKNAMVGAVKDCVRYPDSNCQSLRDAISLYHGISADRIICGNGAADIIFTLVQAARPRRALLVSPSFQEYEQALRAVDCQIEWFDLKEENDFCLSVSELLAFLRALETPQESSSKGLFKKELPDMMFFCNPNNPTGFAVEKESLRPLLEFCESRKIRCVMDECFNEFLDRPEHFSVMDGVKSGRWQQLFVLRAFTKIYGMAGVRLGYGLTADQKFLESMERCRQPWSVSALAQAAGEAALQETEFIRETKDVIGRERQRLKDMLAGLGFYVYGSMANYVFFRDDGASPVETAGKCADRHGFLRGRLYEECLERGILIRPCWNYRSLDNRYYRVCVKTACENDELAAVLEAVLNDRRKV